MNGLVIPPWARLLAAVVLVGAVLGAFYAYGQQQLGLGEKAERALWLARENAELAGANARIQVLEDQARQREREHAQDMADASAQFQEGLKHAQVAKDRAVAELRRGDIRLRVPVAVGACPGPAAGAGAATAGPGPGASDGQARAELSFSAAEFLVGLASEADEVVHQLSACQAIVAADRRLQRK